VTDVQGGTGAADALREAGVASPGGERGEGEGGEDRGERKTDHLG
jgi:hypothetical protein